MYSKLRWTALWAVFGLLAGLSAVGCDPGAKANANDRALIAKDYLSKAYETCAATRDCSEGLRCLQSVCVSPQASVVGDYNAAVGARELAAGNVAKAIESYTAAVNRYKSDKVPVPTELHCSQGEALAAAAQQPEMAEGAARALDQCLRGAPVGSALRQRALRQLAALGGAGLEPEHLGSGDPPPRYMTKQPAAPPTAGLKVKVASDGKARGKAFTDLNNALAADNVRTALIPCWEAHWNATQQSELSAPVQMRYRFLQGEYEEDDRFKLGAEPDAAANEHQKCVADAVAALLDEFNKTRRSGPAWTSTVTITIGK